MIEFDRDIYKKISEWQNGYSNNKVLFIEGSRQIGKTHVINNFVNNKASIKRKERSRKGKLYS
jgi:AAA+ ATPase superfamily predicted ATPase